MSTKKIASFCAVCLFSLAANGAVPVFSGSGDGMASPLILADTRGMERRDDRRDDRIDIVPDRGDVYDCRQEEGYVGHDKRDCKQDARHDNYDYDHDDD